MLNNYQCCCLHVKAMIPKIDTPGDLDVDDEESVCCDMIDGSYIVTEGSPTIIKLSPAHRKFIFNDNFYFYLSFEPSWSL